MPARQPRRASLPPLGNKSSTALRSKTLALSRAGRHNFLEQPTGECHSRRRSLATNSNGNDWVRRHEFPNTVQPTNV